MSVVFEWDIKDFDQRVKNCETNPSTPYILKYLPNNGLVLEAGCGLGQFVKFLSDKGYAMKGIEINGEAVAAVNRAHPELDIIAGDVAHLPYPDSSLDSVLSLGVVEHFIEGPEQALREMYRVMKPGGVSLICVPEFNTIRRLKHYTGLDYAEFYLRRFYLSLRGIRRPAARQSGLASRQYRFYRWPVTGEFYEYRFREKEFDRLLTDAGFSIEHQIALETKGGLYQEFTGLVTLRQYEHPGRFFEWVDRQLLRFHHFHNHMYLCIIRKPN